MKLLRNILFIIAALSLLVIPYSFIAWACYAGLCGGGASHEIGQKYGTFYGYYGFIYLPIIVVTLIAFFSQRKNLRNSIIILLMPIIALIPFIYVEINGTMIEKKYEQQRNDYYSAHADDYVCAPNKFIRLSGNQHYVYFEVTSHGSMMNNYFSYQELKDGLASHSLDVTKCKNKANEIIKE